MAGAKRSSLGLSLDSEDDGAVAVLAAFATAEVAGDVDALRSLFTYDGQLWSADGTRCRGVDAIADHATKRTHAIAFENYEVGAIEPVATSHSLAAYRFRYAWATMIEGEPAGGTGAGTAVLVLEADAWRIAHLHLIRADAPLSPSVVDVVVREGRL